MMRKLQNIALLSFFFSINFEVWDPLQTGGFFSISKLTGFFYLIVMLPSIVNSYTDSEDKKLLWPLILFFFLFSLTNLFSAAASMFNFIDITLVQNIALFWILLQHERREPMVLEKGMLAFASGSIVMALLYYNGVGISYSEDGRISIFGDNQNIIGIKMCISIITITLITLQNTLQLGKYRFFLLLPLPIMLHLMALSGSRVAMISFLTAFLAAGFLWKTEFITKKILLFIVITIAFGAVLQYVLQTDIIKQRLLQSLQERDLSGREEIWRNILPVIKSNPILGIGQTGYNVFIQSIYGVVKSPHNVILEILCYTGFIGLITYLVFFTRIIKKAFSLYRTEDLLLPVLILVPVIGLMLTGQLLLVKTGWIIFAYIAGRPFYLINEEQNNEMPSDY